MLGGLFALGAVCWLLIDPDRPVFDDGLADAAVLRSDRAVA
jgi:hypothetical protein